MKAWKCGEEKYCILKLIVSSKVSCNLFFREKLKSCGFSTAFNINVKMLAFSKQRHIAHKENIVLLKYLVKI